MQPILDHVHVTVHDMAEAVPFYDAVLPVLGFDLARKHEGRVEAHELHVIEYVHDRLVFTIGSPRAALADEPVHRRRPGALHHMAFRADSPEEVDRVAAELVSLGVEMAGGPKRWPQHGEGYYAVFFKDPGGIKYEVMHEPRELVGS